MYTNPTKLLVAVLSLLSAAAAFAQQNPDELKQRILDQALSLSPDDYAFTRTTRSEANFIGKTAKVVTVERFDPTKPARWTLVSVDGAPPSAAESRKYRKKAANRRVVPGYHRLANYFGAPAIVSSEDRAKTVFRFHVHCSRARVIHRSEVRPVPHHDEQRGSYRTNRADPRGKGQAGHRADLPFRRRT